MKLSNKIAVKKAIADKSKLFELNILFLHYIEGQATIVIPGRYGITAPSPVAGTRSVQAIRVQGIVILFFYIRCSSPSL